ncbi:MAG: protein kinase [Elusimicrobia bacterium]|nr:protein kinase [Elusimicrobiota bacterium]
MNFRALSLIVVLVFAAKSASGKKLEDFSAPPPASNSQGGSPTPTPAPAQQALPVTAQPIAGADESAANNQETVNRQPETNATPIAAATSESVRQALEFADAGDAPAARQVIRQALADDPENPRLREVAKLLEPKVDGRVDAARLREQTRGWLEQRPIEGTPQGAALYAAAGPAALPAAVAMAGSPVLTAQTGGPKLYMQNGLAVLKLGDPARAEWFFTAKIQEDPGNAVAYRFRSMARRALKNPVGALADAEQAIRLRPRDAGARQARALVLLDSKRPREALVETEKALELEPKNAELHHVRALAHEQLGDRTAILAELEQAAALDAQYREIYRQALRGPQAPAAPSGKFPIRWLFVLMAAAGLGAVGWGVARKETKVSAVSTSGAESRLRKRGFILGERIGRGGMGEVFEGVDLTLDRPVAIKRLREELSTDPRERRRFIKEARTVAALKHPRIVEIHHAFEDSGELYLVFERITGRPLSDVMSERGALPPSEALEVARQVADALDYAHGAGVVHRDLKPSNIMIAPAGVKVMDFGIARRVLDTLSTASMAEVVGTPQYMAPEQARGLASSQTDVYALGVCLHELATGRMPEPGQVPASLPPTWKAAIERATHPEPASRFATAGAFIAALC